MFMPKGTGDVLARDGAGLVFTSGVEVITGAKASG